MGALAPSGAPAWTARVASFMGARVRPGAARVKPAEKKTPGAPCSGGRKIEARSLPGRRGDQDPGGRKRFDYLLCAVRMPRHIAAISERNHPHLHGVRIADLQDRLRSCIAGVTARPATARTPALP